ncbi:ferroxidase fet3 [Sorochytrium milnesiophthora]
MHYALTAACLLLLSSYVLAKERLYPFDITYVNHVSADGLKGHERTVIGVNGAWPPPIIEVDQGDTLTFHIHNKLNASTSLHWHGIYQNGTTWMDGSVGNTQWYCIAPLLLHWHGSHHWHSAIPPGGTYTYRFTAYQHGTFWYHSHFMGQYTDGLRGPLIVHPRQEAYSCDGDYTILLSDWYFDMYDVNLNKLLHQGIPPLPDSTSLLVTRNGRYVDDKTLHFDPGRTYRVRVINVSAFATAFVGITGHDMEVIEADTTDVEAAKVGGQLQLGVAQRYSVRVKARQDASRNWNIHASMVVLDFNVTKPTFNPNITIPIVYHKDNLVDPAPYVPGPILDDLTLVPLLKQPSSPPDMTIVLSVTFGILTDREPHMLINNITYVPPPVPSLLTAQSMGQLATNPAVYGPMTDAFVLPHNAMVQVVLQNVGGGVHPFHLHGHSVQIMKRSDTLHDPNQPIPEQPNPMRRDTYHLPNLGSLVFRFRADNPGAWLFHCHIQWHMDMGLAALFVEAPEQLQRMTPPPELKNNCAAQGIPTSGNAAGKQGLDLSGAPFGPFLPPPKPPAKH